MQAIDNQVSKDVGDLLAGEPSCWLKPGEGGVAQAEQRFDNDFLVEIGAEVTGVDAFLHDGGPDVFVIFEERVGGNGRFLIQ